MTTKQLAELRHMLSENSLLTLDQARQMALDAIPDLLAAAEREQKLREALQVLYDYQQRISSPDTRWELPVYQQARAALAEGGAK